MAKFNFKSIYSQAEPYTVIGFMNKMIDYLDSVEYATPSDVTAVLYEHRIHTSTGYEIVFVTNSNQYVTTTSEFLLWYERFGCELDPGDNDYHRVLKVEQGSGNTLYMTLDNTEVKLDIPFQNILTYNITKI